jgi:CRISPR-associated protein Cas2
MRRKHYVVTYDISDDKRRNRVFQTLHGFGDHAQYSVFFCELNDEELARLRRRLRDAIHHAQDQVLIVEMGTAPRPVQTGIEVIGRDYDPPVRTIVV